MKTICSLRAETLAKTEFYLPCSNSPVNFAVDNNIRMINTMEVCSARKQPNIAISKCWIKKIPSQDWWGTPENPSTGSQERARSPQQVWATWDPVSQKPNKLKKKRDAGYPCFIKRKSITQKALSLHQTNRPVMLAPSTTRTTARTAQCLRTQKTEKDSHVQGLADWISVLESPNCRYDQVRSNPSQISAFLTLGGKILKFIKNAQSVSKNQTWC